MNDFVVVYLLFAPSLRVLSSRGWDSETEGEEEKEEEKEALEEEEEEDGEAGRDGEGACGRRDRAETGGRGGGAGTHESGGLRWEEGAGCTSSRMGAVRQRHGI